MAKTISNKTPIHVKLILYSEDGPNGCRVWMRGRNTHGYGRVSYNGKWCAAHRVSYETFVGPIPAGLDLDHLCRNRACINPAHLEPVTEKENALRGIGFCALNAAKTHCKYNHHLDGDNLYIYQYRGRLQRQCRVCREARRAKHRAKIKSLSQDT